MDVGYDSCEIRSCRNNSGDGSIDVVIDEVILGTTWNVKGTKDESNGKYDKEKSKDKSSNRSDGGHTRNEVFFFFPRTFFMLRKLGSQVRTGLKTRCSPSRWIRTAVSLKVKYCIDNASGWHGCLHSQRLTACTRWVRMDLHDDQRLSRAGSVACR